MRSGWLLPCRWQASEIVASKDYVFDNGGNIQRMWDKVNFPSGVYRNY